MARLQTFLVRLCCVTLAVVFAFIGFAGKAGDWPTTIVGIVLFGFCLLVFIFDVFGARLRRQFPLLSRFGVKPVRLVVTDERTDVYFADGTRIFSVANQIVWRPGTKGGEVVAVGAPDEWLSSSRRVLPADAVHTDLVAEAFAATPQIDELWEAFFCYCIEVSRRKVGFWRWFGRQFFSPLKVDLRIRDDVKKEFVGRVLRRCKLFGPVDVFTTNVAVDS